MGIRYKIAVIFFSAILLILLIRVYYLSILSHEYYSDLADSNTNRIEILVPVRGQILDRNKKPLAINNLGYSIALNPYLGKKSNLNQLDEEINKITRNLPNLDSEMLKKEYLSKYSIYNHDYIVVVPFVPYVDMFESYTILLQSDNIKISNASRRFYPYGSLASHVIGYIGAVNADEANRDADLKHYQFIGKTGLEKYYNDFLQGDLGFIKTKVDVLNKVVEVVDESIVTERNDIKLSLDINLQVAMDLEFKDKAGAAIIMDARNGEILAAGSYPEYELNYFVDGMTSEQWDSLLNNLDNPFLNKISSAAYPPGSIVKMGVGMSFLEYADINERTSIETPAFIEVGGRKFRDWTAKGHGSADLIKAIRRSVDVYFYKLSQKIGDENMSKTLKTFGFGELTGIDLPNEARGILPNKEWKLINRGEPWLIGDTIITSIGQGLFLSTPIQVAQYTALLATGKMPTPHFVTNLGSDELNLEPLDILSDFQKSKLQFLQLGMYQVCNREDGTAYNAVKGAPIPLACKTGTAQVVGIPQDMIARIPERQMEYFHRSHAWITAYLPYKNPKYVITILVEHGGSAGKATGGILVNLSKKLLELGYLKD